MVERRWTAGLAAAALLAGCGGGDGGGGSGAPAASTPTPTPSASPTPTPVAGCALRARQDWVRAQLDEWYLFPETVPAALDPAGYASVEAYLDALTATARAQRKDRYFSYIASIAEENAYYGSGATAGLGVRLTYDIGGGRLFVAEAFEGAPALAAGVDRGTQVLAIGTSAATLRDVAAIFASEGETGIDAALGPNTPGTTRVLRVRDTNGTEREVTLAKRDYAIAPVSQRYGYRVIDDGGRKVGYLNLRTFIGTADDQLRDAFAAFRAQGVTALVVDLRYNGGGLVSTAELVSDLMGGARSTGDVQSYTTYRASKAAENETRTFRREANALAPAKIAFIGTGGTASASEYVINAFVPYLHGDAALIGANTYGKPVGQIALDNPSCPDDRLRLVAFALQNASRVGDYYDGLATRVGASCQADDDLAHALGDPAEASVRAALDFVAGRGCTRIGASAAAARGGAFAPARTLLTPARPGTAQRETPGLF
jgi:carboxyl-terminal processing protease